LTTNGNVIRAKTNQIIEAVETRCIGML